MIILQYTRFGAKSQREYPTVKDAAFSACLDIETNEACPLRITENGKDIWVYGSPWDGSTDRLRKLAEWVGEEI